MKASFYLKLAAVLLASFFISTKDGHAQDMQFAWAAGMGAGSPDIGRSIAVDASGNVYTTGYFQGTADFNPGAGTYNLTSNNGSIDIFVQKLDASGNFLWAKSMGSTAGDEAYAIVVDASGNVYTTGHFTGTVDFDPGTGIHNLISVSTNNDIFIQKLDASGNFVWAKSMGGPAADQAYAIAVDASANVYTTGVFQGTADFDPGAGIENLTSGGNFDIFVSKLDASGNFVWAKSMGGILPDVAYGIAVDASGNVYTTGSFQGTADFDPGTGTANLLVAGNNDIFVSKLDASGHFVWAKSMGGTANDIAYGIAVDASGNIYTTGYFAGTVDFDPGIGTANLLAAGDNDIFVHKLDALGNFVWAKNMGGTLEDVSNGIALDASGNVYITGYFRGTADLDPGTGTSNLVAVGGSSDIFVSKLDASGNFLWAKSTGGILDDRGNGIAVNASGNAHTTGYFRGTVDFNPGTGISNLVAVGNADIFVSKLKSISRLHVDSLNGNDANTGANWSAALKTLSKAIDMAHTYLSVDSILVAKGTYYPTGTQISGNPTTAQRDSTFLIKRGGIKIYGGYATPVAGVSTRNITANPTILSGAISSTMDSTVNSYHVMVIAGIAQSADSIVADGLSITKGNANGEGLATYNGVNNVSQNYGGGILTHSNNSNPRIALRFCSLSGNTGGYGGGMYNLNSSPGISSCTFTGNSAINQGGGINNGNPSSLLISNSVFTGNTANDGSGMYNNANGTTTIINCTFNGNNGGNVIYNSNTAANILNCIIYGNSLGINQAGTVQNSLVQGLTSISDGNLNGNSTNPLFVNAAAGDLQLQACSPAINAGNNNSIPAGITSDISGASRIQQSTVDMGAYESSFNRADTPAVVTAMLPANPVCPSTSVTFTATVTNGGSNPTYQWYKNALAVGANQNTYTHAAWSNNDSVWVVVSNSTCTMLLRNSIMTYLQVNPDHLVPSVVVSNTTTANTLCEGTPVTFTATATNGGASPAYQWRKNGLNIGTNSATYTDNALANGDIITVRLTSDAACRTLDTINSAATIMTVNPGLVPSVIVSNTAPSNTLCEGTNITFTATATNGGASPVYQWRKNGLNTGTNSTTYTDNALTNGDVITVRLTSNALCSTSDTTNSVNTTMTVNALPQPVITRNGLTLSTAATYSTYQWYRDGIAIQGATDYAILVQLDGMYTVVVTNNTACENVSNQININNVGIDAINADAIAIYPNPAKGIINIKTPMAVHASLFTMDGQLLMKTQNNVALMHISNVASGMYILKVYNSKNQVLKVQKIIVDK